MSDEETTEGGYTKDDTEPGATTDVSEVPDSTPDEDNQKVTASKTADSDDNRDEEDDEDETFEKEEIDYTFSPIDLVTAIFQNRYYWDIFKSTIMFLVALKMARECRMLRIPMKEYKPFNRCNHFF